jgi:hypothetical protein
LLVDTITKELIAATSSMHDVSVPTATRETKVMKLPLLL